MALKSRYSSRSASSLLALQSRPDGEGGEGGEGTRDRATVYASTGHCGCVGSAAIALAGVTCSEDLDRTPTALALLDALLAEHCIGRDRLYV